MTIYLDCNATSPIEPIVNEEVMKYLSLEFGNAGSRTHEYGTRAKQAVQKARDQIAEVVQAQRDEVIFTSGATESNNLAILGLAEYGQTTGKKHIISTMIEHKAVLEPLEVLGQRGFEISLLPPTSGGWIDPEKINRILRDDTLLVSCMHANNETGVLQPIGEIAQLLGEHPSFFHVDAAQGFGKDINGLRDSRIDLISISGHKIHAPKGVGALITRRRKFKRPPLKPLLYGGGQERGLRPGTLPVALIVGLGKAATLALKNTDKRAAKCYEFRQLVLQALTPLTPKIHGDQEKILPHVLNLSFPGLDSEAVMVALKDLIAVSNGSACTSQSYEPSHVLEAMQLPEEEIRGAIRISWCHMTEEVDWGTAVNIIQKLR
jgi:cysteine desulfurase